MTDLTRGPITAIQAPVEVMGKLLALISAACLVLSVIYDWGSLAGLGLSYDEVATTISDHLRSAIIWMPAALLIFVLTMVLSRWETTWSLRRRNRALSNGERAEEYDRKNARQTTFILISFGVVSILGWAIFGDQFLEFAAAGSLILLMMALVYVTNINPQNRKWMKWVRRATVLSLIAGALLFSLGFYKSKLLIAPDLPLHQLILKTNASSETKPGRVIRSFEKSVIVLNERREIVVMKPEELSRFQLTAPAKKHSGLVCMIREQFCKR